MTLLNSDMILLNHDDYQAMVLYQAAENDRIAALKADAAAGDMLAAAEFMSPDESEKICRNWLASQDSGEFANAYWSHRWFKGYARVLDSTFYADSFPIYIGCGLYRENQPPFQCMWVAENMERVVLYAAPSLPALCRWLRVNLPRLFNQSKAEQRIAMATPDYLSHPTVYVSRNTFERLMEYSHSVPSMTTIGKWWKAKTINNQWLLCCYAEHPDPNKVRILRRRLEWLPWVKDDCPINGSDLPTINHEASFH